MSRGIGQLQQHIKRILDAAVSQGRCLCAGELLKVFAAGEGDLSPTRKRAIGRAVKSLVDRGDVLIVHGSGRPGDPYHYVTVEYFASATGETIRDTAHAKEVVAELATAAQGALAKFERQ